MRFRPVSDAGWQAALVLAGLAILLAFWTALSGPWQENQNYDYVHYYRPYAERILAGHGFVGEKGEVNAHYPPGFPLVTALVLSWASWFGEGGAWKVMTALCRTLCVFPIFGLARDFLGRRAAVVATLLWMTYPFVLWLAKQPNSETPFLVFFLWSIWLYLRLWRTGAPHLAWLALGAGMLMGGAVLMRAIAVVIGPLMAAFLLALGVGTWMQRLWRPALLLVGVGAMVAPWQIYLASHGERVFVARSGPTGMVDGMTFALETKASGTPLEVSPGVRRMMETVAARPEICASVGSLLRFWWDEFQSHPADLVALLWLKATRAWYGTNAQWLERETALVQLPYVALWMGGLVWGWRHQRHMTLWIALTVLAFWGMTLLVLPLLRYMTPAISLLFVPLAGWVTSWPWVARMTAGWETAS
jgi:4-amino-4-deoxy-L-arabinose transferase-like glycosyltransferase